jgi:hypothetical protein
MGTKLIYEEDVAMQLGVPRARVSELRKELGLERGPEWRYGKNNRVYLTLAGVTKVMEALEKSAEQEPPSENEQKCPSGASLGEDADKETCEDKNPSPVEDLAGPARNLAADDKPSPSPLPFPVVDAVVKSVPKQKRVLVCEVAGEEQLIRALCRDNRNFIPGMQVKLRKPVDVVGLWYFEGKAPRRRGKW